MTADYAGIKEQATKMACSNTEAAELLTILAEFCDKIPLLEAEVKQLRYSVGIYAAMACGMHEEISGQSG